MEYAQSAIELIVFRADRFTPPAHVGTVAAIRLVS